MVRLWDPRTGEQVATLGGHQGWVYAVCAVTVDGRHLLASGGDATVRLWDPLSGEQVAEMVGHQEVYTRCARYGRRPGPAGQRQQRRYGASVGPAHR